MCATNGHAAKYQCRDAAQSRVAAIGVELEQRESSLRDQLHSHQAASATEAAQLTAEVARLTHELDLTNAQVNLRCHLMSCQAALGCRLRRLLL